MAAFTANETHSALQMPITDHHRELGDPQAPQVDDDLRSVHRHYHKHRLVVILLLEGTAHHLLLHHPREDSVPVHVFLRAALDDSLSDERQNS
jgi:hypothetical protein